MKRLFSHNITVLILLIILTGIVYLNSLNNGFHFDDYHHIVKNKHIRSLNNIPRFFIDMNTFSFGDDSSTHYRPLVLVSHTINYSIGRLNPAGYHIMSLTFHIGTAFLLFLIVQAILGSSTPTLSLPHQGGGKKGGGAASPFFIALSSAIIFAVHPFNSEAINYITARSSVMSGFFYLLAFYCWVKYRKQSQETLQSGMWSAKSPDFASLECNDSSRCIPYYIASLLAFLLGMLSKEVVITLPIVLWLYDLYFIHPFRTPHSAFRTLLNWRSYLPYLPFVLLVAIPYIIVRAHFIVSGLRSPGSGYYLHLLKEAKVIAKYVYLFFVPAGLSFDHVISTPGSIWEIGAPASIVLLMFLLITTFFLYKTNNIEWRLVSFFFFWFFIALIPVTIVALQAPLQENRGYIAGIGFSLFLGVLLNRFAYRSKRRAIIRITVLTLIIILCSVVTIDRNYIWAKEFTLWQDAVNKSPMSWRGYYGLGKVYYDYKLRKMAFSEFTKAVEIKPDYFDALYALGLMYTERNELGQARLMLERAIKTEPWQIKAHMQLGEVYEKSGEIEPALREFGIVVRLGERLGEGEEMVLRAKSHIRWIRGKESEVRSKK